jgi:hypothetical protein
MGWMDGVDGWMCYWMDGIDGWMDVLIDGWMDGMGSMDGIDRLIDGSRTSCGVSCTALTRLCLRR